MSSAAESQGMSIAMGALIASGSLVLSMVVLGSGSGSSDLAVEVALIPGGLTLLSAVGVVLLRRHRSRKKLTLRPALVSLVVWSVVGVPVLALASHILPYFLASEDENSQAAIVLMCLGLIFNGLWIAPLISLGVAAGVGTGNRNATVR